ncbi:MAG: sulfatase-like hydrolase/transferase [Ginsengibacter sp.]
MKKYSGYIAYFAYWLLFFIVTKALFLVYNHSLTSGLGVAEVIKVFAYGFRMDVSFTAYTCIFPFLLFFLKETIVTLRILTAIRIYTICLVVLLSFLSVADYELYRAWGYRMDITPLQYLKSPKEMGTSMYASPILLLCMMLILLAIFFIWMYKKYIEQYIPAIRIKFSIARLLFSLFIIAFLFVPIRGGIQKIPINQSNVYFSEKLFANHAALNLPWNIMSSLLNKNSDKNPFEYFSQQEAGLLVNKLYSKGALKIPSALAVKKPNIIFIILESFTAKLVGCVGGEPGVTPNLDKIASEGLLFTNIYAAGDRSEKGQIAVLSGYPNQAITSIIKTPKKTENLPAITRTLKNAGYHTSFTYGGELEFANIKSYLLNAGFDDLVSKYSFNPSERTTSWGVHDHIVLNRFLGYLQKEKQPFFATLFTLSSHEPYDVPGALRFKSNDETTLFRNSIAYTDSVIGVFITKLQKDPLWQNTLIVFVADHGHPLPGHDPNDHPSKFHIPLIFTGGALKLHGVVPTIGSQTDILTTVLDQLDISAAAYKWGKDLLDSSARQFAFYSFNNGFGFVTPSGTFTMDNISKKIIYQTGVIDSATINTGKAYMQLSYQDFLSR